MWMPRYAVPNCIFLISRCNNYKHPQKRKEGRKKKRKVGKEHRRNKGRKGKSNHFIRTHF